MTVELQLNWDGSSAGGWTDYTDSVVLDNFTRERSLNGQNDPQKTVTAEIEFFGAAYSAVKANLIDSVNRYSNYYVIKMTDSDCTGDEYYFKIEDRALRWCDNGDCRLQVTLLEYNPQLDCIYRTTVADNTYGEFQDYPASGNPHPRFRYCDVVKPTFLYGAILTFVNAVVLFIVSLNIVIASITGIIVWIVNLLGGSWSVPTIGFGFAEDLLGCGRGHPAPFVRSYIDNICLICGVDVTNTTAPILYDTVDSLGNTNEYYWLAIATAYTKKGVDMTGAKGYIPSNQPSWTLDKMLSMLKPVFNARWFLYDNIIYFGRKDLIGESIWGTTPMIDLSGADADYLLGDVCYTYNGKGKPKKLIYNYGTDPSDNIGNELLRRFNGIYEDVSGNKNYNEIIETQILEFAPAASVLDGQDSAYDANIVKALSGVLIGTDYEGCLKTQGDTFALAKLLIWDNLSEIKDARLTRSLYDIYGSAGADISAFKNDDANFIPVNSSDCWNYNFPMSFDPDANDIGGNGFKNLWQFHSIDTPDAADRSGIDIDFTLQYCCSYNTLNIYQTVLLQDAVTEAEIYFVKFDHAKREIQIKAKLK